MIGIEGGKMQGIPWQALPLTHSFVKERLALAAFSNCHCNFSSASWPLGTGFGTNSTHSGSLQWFLGCLYSKWQEGAMGTLVFPDRQGGSVLQQDILVLSRFHNSPLLEITNNTLITDPLYS